MKILLASGSPRRLELLQSLGLDVLVKVSNVLELDDASNLSAEEIARENAVKKARGVYQEYGLMGHDLVLGADTVVTQEGRIFGKPNDLHDAARILTQLSDGKHDVITSYCLVGKGGGEQCRSVWSTVEFRHLSSSEIEAYLKTNEWPDKAGGYAVQGAGAALIKQVLGSLTNVIGLPVDEVIRDARELIKTQ